MKEVEDGCLWRVGEAMGAQMRMDRRVGEVVVVKITLGKAYLAKIGSTPTCAQCHWPGDANELSGDESLR
jgi:hypothetical protein